MRQSVNDAPADTPFPNSLCRRCQFVREIVSGKGSVFLMCGFATRENGLSKYPPQPVHTCGVYEPAVGRADA